MPWEPVEVMSLKREFVEFASAEGANLSELCRRFGISRPTGYKWVKRWQAGGLAELEERSRRPEYSPNRSNEEIEQAVLAIREDNPVWGGRKIRRRMLDLGHAKVPSASTVTAILRRHGRLSAPVAGKAQGPWKRFERSVPNDLWQMDFKGHFGTEAGERCHPLTVLDDHSRFNLVLKACGDERGETVQASLTEAFRRYGLPAQILCDNARPWGALESPSGHTTLGVWLLERGVEVIHGGPYHPQTQGKEERFHRTLKAEVITQRTVWRDLHHCDRAFKRWREKYNHERPHESLADEVPAKVYQPSPRALPSIIAEPESHYLTEDELRRVKSKGEITYRNHFFYIGSAFIGKSIALRQLGEQEWEVYYCWKRLGKIDLKAATKAKYRYHKLQP